jgi:hypothetical protein
MRTKYAVIDEKTKLTKYISYKFPAGKLKIINRLAQINSFIAKCMKIKKIS